MAALQVAINPLLRVAGGEEHFAFNAAFAQLVFGAASFVSPQVYSYVVLHLGTRSDQDNVLLLVLRRLVPAGLPWVSMYWIFSGVIILMLGMLAASGFPQVKRTEEEQAGALHMYRYLLRKPVVLLFFASGVMYVGSEQGTADWISQFLEQYHHLDPHTAGAMAVAWFWGLLTLGCAVGMLLLKLFDSRRVLLGFSLGALASLTVAVVGPAPASMKLMELLGLKIGDFDIIELNEAFAAQGLAVMRQLGLPDDAAQVNPQGGAIALGHPLGASGGRLAATALYQLNRTGGKRALCTMCIGVGQGIATVVESLALPIP